MDQVSQEDYETLRAALRRIKRRADVMVLDAQIHSAAWHSAQELQRLADIALRCLKPDPAA
jgi:hypothetical protein